jgi:hypothetical protein
MGEMIRALHVDTAEDNGLVVFWVVKDGLASFENGQFSIPLGLFKETYAYSAGPLDTPDYIFYDKILDHPDVHWINKPQEPR